MNKYFAIQEIGGYRIGDEVPEDKALLWKKMYSKSPVETKVVPDLFPKDYDLNKDGKLDEKDFELATKIVKAKPKKSFFSKK